MTRREHESLRAIKEGLKLKELKTDGRDGLITALDTLRDYYAAKDQQAALEDLIGALYKPHFGTDQTPEQAAYNEAIRDVLAIIRDRKEGIA